MHAQNVQKNHDILKRLIDVVCFLRKQELLFHNFQHTDRTWS